MTKACPDCGCRVYKHGCVNCNEAAYIAVDEAYELLDEARCVLCGEHRSKHTKSPADWRDVPGCTGHYLMSEASRHA